MHRNENVTGVKQVEYSKVETKQHHCHKNKPLKSRLSTFAEWFIYKCIKKLIIRAYCIFTVVS